MTSSSSSPSDTYTDNMSYHSLVQETFPPRAPPVASPANVVDTFNVTWHGEGPHVLSDAEHINGQKHILVETPGGSVTFLPDDDITRIFIK